ncbi:hypothetical protein JK635_08265 [Neobacillus sp. YIM B02564]|uniref:Uncharacterized protein n=1 Tax=Neobacillus paridis TaxID=2803862 RepID=A0ABS1TLQ7_9BACI|nr:hypothetical protein [Neobacillus paridis]MBL4952202.1 hypothetical protein [Neobacillus paridis]
MKWLNNQKGNFDFGVGHAMIIFLIGTIISMGIVHMFYHEKKTYTIEAIISDKKYSVPKSMATFNFDTKKRVYTLVISDGKNHTWEENVSSNLYKSVELGDRVTLKITKEEKEVVSIEFPDDKNDKNEVNF